jgi:hypothetical protein
MDLPWVVSILQIAVPIVALAFTVYQMILHRQQLALTSPPAPGATKTRWFQQPTMVMVILAAAAWVPYLLRLNSPSALAIRPIIRLVPAGPEVCAADLDGGQLQRFREKYNVLLVCGIVDPTMDKMRDRRITISPPLTIRTGTISIAVPWDVRMAKAIKQVQEDARKAAPPPPKGTVSFTVTQIGVWVDTVLLPKGVDPAEIHQLSDVLRHQGKIIELN